MLGHFWSNIYLHVIENSFIPLGRHDSHRPTVQIKFKTKYMDIKERNISLAPRFGSSLAACMPGRPEQGVLTARQQKGDPDAAGSRCRV